MKSAIVTKTLAKLDAIQDDYSIGFKRWQVLPKTTVQKVILACLLKGENNYQSMIAYFQTLSNDEYVNWLKNA